MIKNIIKLNYFLLLTIFTLLYSIQATANTNKNNDLQSWDTLIVTNKLNNNYLLYNELHLRLGYDITRVSQIYYRPALAYQIDKNNSLWLGYTIANSDKPFVNKNTYEHNIWQQYLTKVNYNAFDITSRSRLEERFIQRTSKTGLRYRQLFKATTPINYGIINFLAISDEIFFQLNDTNSKSDNRGFSENRFYIGFGTKLNNQTSIEFGYQHQYVRKFKQNDFNADIIIFNINYNN